MPENAFWVLETIQGSPRVTNKGPNMAKDRKRKITQLRLRYQGGRVVGSNPGADKSFFSHSLGVTIEAPSDVNKSLDGCTYPG